MTPHKRALLEVTGLSVTFRTDAGQVHAVTDLSMSVEAGQTLAIVGESGSGKSVTALALMRLHPRSATIEGSVLFDGTSVLELSDREMRAVRGSSIAMIFQDPMTALNPVFSIGDQIVEMLRAHQKVPKNVAWARAAELLEVVGVPEPGRRVKQYPHEFSGGMRQRAMIAMAIANSPKLLIADEPTTALDVTIQAQVMEVIAAVQKDTGAALILITHDLGLVAGSADCVQVMYGSRVLERGGLDEVFYNSANPYTRALLASIPSAAGRASDRLKPIPGNPPSLLRPKPGCPFRPRCEMAIEVCGSVVPEMQEVSAGHLSRCHRSDELIDAGEVVR
jgi:oligopeptide/dipeptide ABC transporter ATP-binding protein